jgi:hypothetical protein
MIIFYFLNCPLSLVVSSNMTFRELTLSPTSGRWGGSFVLNTNPLNRTSLHPGNRNGDTASFRNVVFEEKLTTMDNIKKNNHVYNNLRVSDNKALGPMGEKVTNIIHT